MKAPFAVARVADFNLPWPDGVSETAGKQLGPEV
jgi:hypothetical protein